MGRPAIHGLRYHPLYIVWRDMKQRCLNIKSEKFKHYGGRGITVCERWLDFKNFHDDMITGYEKGLQLDRIENNGNYEPSNCRWATRSQNTKNRRCAASKQSLVDHVWYNSSDGRWSYQKWFKTQEEAEGFAREITSG